MITFMRPFIFSDDSMAKDVYLKLFNYVEFFYEDSDEIPEEVLENS